MNETVESLRITEFIEDELGASADVDGVVSVSFRLSRPLTKFEKNYNDSLGDQALEIDTYQRAVVLESIQVHDIREWAAKVNRVLDLIETEAGTAHRRYERNMIEARRALHEIDFDTI